MTKFIESLNKHFFKLTSPCIFYGANVVQMQTPDIVEIFDDHVATLKIDGERHILFLFVEKDLSIRAFVMCRNGTINDIVIPNFCILRRDLSKLTPGFFSVFDAEYYNGRWIVFDCLVFRASKMVCTNQDFTERLRVLQRSFQEDFQSDYIHVKPYFDVTELDLYQKTINTLGFDVEHDGIIYQPTKGIYPIGGNMNLLTGRGLKWKDVCTIDLVPERIKLLDIRRLHTQVYGEQTILKTYWNNLIHSNDYYGTHEYNSNVGSSLIRHGKFEIPSDLCKLRCVSDFSYGSNPILIPVTCRLQDSTLDIPLCITLPQDLQTGVKEFSIDHTLQFEYQKNRDDKLVAQANKARTVAGILWQAKNYRPIQDFIQDRSLVPPRIQHVLPEIISNSNCGVSFHEFIRGYLSFESHGKTFIENEFKIIQTKRPKSGVIFQSLQTPNYECSSCLDGLHYQRAIDGIIKKYKKADPPERRTIDFIVDSSLKLTANEDIIQTKSGKPLVLYKTDGFFATRKVASGQSYFVQLPEIEKKSGYVYRLDTRTESPEFFLRREYLSENEEHFKFLENYQNILTSTKRKRAELPINYKGYRFVDSLEFKPEIERNVPLDKIRRAVFDPLQIGEIVEVNYHGIGQYHSGRIMSISEKTVDVEYAYNVRAMNFHYKNGYIPIIIDAQKGNMLRIKRRKTFEFDGFKIDFTRTKNIIDFKPTESRRLHHMMNRCDNYEIEVELSASIKFQTSFVEKLREVLRDLFQFMNLDENAFLFDHVTLPKIPDNLQSVLTDYSKYIGFTDDLRDLHPVFIKTIQGVSRVVRESDFHAMFDEEMDLLCNGNNHEIVEEEVRSNLHKLSAYVEINETIVNDYISRRIFKLLSESSQLTQIGIELFANNICWTTPNETFPVLCKLLDINSLKEIEEDVDFLQQLHSMLFGVTSNVNDSLPFFKAPFLFGKMLFQYFITSEHAWYDEREVSYVWNDIVYFAQRFGNMLYYYVNVHDDLLTYHVHRDTAKLAVIVGFIQECRMNSKPPNEIIEHVNLMNLVEEYCLYTPRNSLKNMDVSILKNVDIVMSL
jgi:hypothetical protein